jgi:hypothetical protein
VIRNASEDLSFADEFTRLEHIISALLRIYIFPV